MVLFYIDGKQVSRTTALNYYVKGLRLHGLGYTEEAERQWLNKSKSEEAREYIFDISAIQEQGGLEIIIETN